MLSAMFLLHQPAPRLPQALAVCTASWSRLPTTLAPSASRRWPSSTAAATAWPILRWVLEFKVNSRASNWCIWLGSLGRLAYWQGCGCMVLAACWLAQAHSQLTRSCWSIRAGASPACAPAAQDVATLLQALQPGAVVYSQMEQDYEHIDFTCAWGAGALHWRLCPC